MFLGEVKGTLAWNKLTNVLPIASIAYSDIWITAVINFFFHSLWM